MNPIYLLTFEDVLLETSSSVVPAIQQAIQDYFSRYLGVRGHGMLADAEDVAAFQRAGGFTTPWELAAAMVRVALDALPGKARGGRPPEDMRRAAAALTSRARTLPDIALETLRERVAFADAATWIATAGGGWAGVAAVVGGLAHPLFLADADSPDTNVVRRLFLEILLGQEGFARVGGGPAMLSKSAGFLPILSSRIPQAQLHTLKRKAHKVALIAAWPSEIVKLLLDALDLASLPDLLLCYEDVTAEEARARRLGEPESFAFPNPWLIDVAARVTDPSGAHPVILVAARPDAIAAARRAERPIEAWALVPLGTEPQPWHDAFARAGADSILEQVPLVMS